MIQACFAIHFLAVFAAAGECLPGLGVQVVVHDIDILVIDQLRIGYHRAYARPVAAETAIRSQHVDPPVPV